MKKTLITLALLLASIAHGRDITVEELNELYAKNVEAYKTVTVGMTAQYIDYELNIHSWCEKDRIEVVTEVIPNSKYEVRITKTTRNDQCGDLPEGAISETSEWRNIKDLEVEEGGYLQLEGNIVSIFKFETYPNKRVTIMRKKVDVTKSQFYNKHRYSFHDGKGLEYNEFTTDLIFRDGKAAYDF